jgi:N-methylhydantoinase A/oxoprolinase/acetone carboxylase beta subunit
LFISII